MLTKAMTRDRRRDVAVERISGPCLNQASAVALARLWCSANEHPGETFEDIWRWILRHWGTDHQRLAPQVVISVVGNDERYLAMAVGFARRIAVCSQPLIVLALGGVCSAPDYRRRGFGAAVVRDQFSRILTGEFACSLFATRPEMVAFYEKLGAGRVLRPVVNSLGTDPRANPFGADVVMGFPSHFQWPEGTIDLLGGGY